MCCGHKGEINGACNRDCKDCLLYSKFFLMRLSVALGVHFGWGSQLNTSEMFWIDISRWMISSRCRWILVYLFWRISHAFELLPFFCSRSEEHTSELQSRLHLVCRLLLEK